MSDPERTLFGHRDGETYQSPRDTDRLNQQALDVWRVMQDGHWHMLAEIARHTGHPEASISARLRDLRKARFGARTIQRKYAGDGLHIYRYVPDDEDGDDDDEQHE